MCQMISQIKKAGRIRCGAGSRAAEMHRQEVPLIVGHIVRILKLGQVSSIYISLRDGGASSMISLMRT